MPMNRYDNYFFFHNREFFIVGKRLYPQGVFYTLLFLISAVADESPMLRIYENVYYGR